MSGERFKNIKYTFVRDISDGAFSKVSLVEFEGKPFALKYLKTVNPDSLIRFRRESSTLARLNHPNLVKLIDTGTEGDFSYLVLEYIAGETLSERLLKDKKLTIQKTIPIISAVAQALSAIHANNLVHRDVKPRNILLSDNIKLIDLGLVGDIEEIKAETALVGTPLYCSPEQTKIFKRDVSFASDLYSLGIVFFELLTGKPPFNGSLNDILQQHSSTPVPNLRTLEPTLDEAVIVIIEKLLAKDPDDRYQSAQGLDQDLQRLDEIAQLLKDKKDPKLGGKEKKTFAVRVKYIERKDEIENLHKVWSEARAGKPGIFIVKGASGSGKSRLCSEFLNRIGSEEQDQVLVLRGKSQASNQDVPFGPLREGLDTFINAISDNSLKKLLAASKGKQPYLIKFSKPFNRLLKNVSQLNTETDVEGEKEKYFNTVVDFFLKLAEEYKGLIFLIDDLQWLDGSSIQLLDRLLDQGANSPIFVLSTARNDDKSAPTLKVIEETLGAAVKGSLVLGGFSKPQMANLLSSYLGTQELDPQIIDFLYSKSTGNPFIATEYLRAVVEQGFLYFESNHWKMVASGLETLSFSSDVYDLIIKRIDSSSAELKTLLSFAALFSNTFDSLDIAKASKLDEKTLSLTLAEGTRLGLIDSLGNNKWKFSHDKIPESLRQSLPLNQSKDMSDQLSLYFKEKSNPSDEELFILARLAVAGNVEKHLDFTVEANLTAGYLSLENQAHGQAFTFLNSAFSLLDRVTISQKRKLELVSKLAVCATMISNWTVAEACVKEALHISTSREESAASLTLKLWVKKTRGDISTAWESFRSACDMLGAPYPAYFHWKLLTTLSLFFASMLLRLTNIKLGFLFLPDSKKGKELSKLADLYFEAQYCSEYKTLLDFILVSLRILFIGQLTGRKRELALGYSSIGYTFASLGIRRIAVPFLDEAVQLSEELGDPVIKATCISRRIEGFIFCGVTYDETTEFMKNLDFNKRYLNPADLGRLRNNIALLLAFKGHNLEALNFLKTYINLQNPASSKLAVLTMLNGLHQYWFNLSILGKSHEAQEAKSIALKMCSPYRFVPVAHRHVSVYELQLRRYTEEIDELVNDLREHYMGNFSSFTEMGGKLNFSQMVFLDLFELERSRSQEELFSMRSRFKKNLQRLYFMLYSPLYRINYFILKAMYYRVKGNFPKAEKWLRVCEKIAEQTGHIRLMFEIHREHARIYRKNNEIMLMKTHLLSALKMVSENQWISIQDSLFTEFGDYAENLLVNFKSSEVLDPSTSASPEESQSRSTTVNVGSGEAEQMRYVDALLRVSRAFVSSLDMLEQSKSVLTQIVKLFAAERGFVFLKNEFNNDYSAIVGKNAQGEDLAHLTGFSSTIVKKALESGQTIIISSSDEAEALGSESAILYNLRSIIITPLTIKDRVLGAVYLDSSLMKGLFSKRDTHLFSTLANNISVAIELSRMAKVELEKAALRKELEIQAAVALESKKVKVLVDNMQQALFSISADGTIVEPVSKFSQKVLGKTIVGESLTAALYKDVSNKEVLSGIDTALKTVFGEDELQWDLMSDQFPRKIEYSADTQKVLRVQPSPVWDNNEHLEKIVFVVEDVTILEDLERRIKEQSLQSTLLGEILESDFKDLKEFFTSARIAIAKTKNTSVFTTEGFSVLLRDLHTLKGNARVFKLSFLSGQIHEGESELAVFKANLADTNPIKVTITRVLEKIEGSLEKYEDLFQKILPSRSTQDTSDISPRALNELTEALHEVESDLPSTTREKLNWAMERLTFKSVKDIAEKYNPMVTDISKQLGKTVEFKVMGDALISPERSQLLKECLVHLLRNSLDHGFETTPERIKAGKTDIGHLTLECAESAQESLISLSDDGLGIDGDQVLKRAIQKGVVTEDQGQVMSDDEKINLIFSPNFSTKTEVTEISGRGIGLDVVKKNIEAMNGELKVTTMKGLGSKFLIRLKREDSKLKDLKTQAS